MAQPFGVDFKVTKLFVDTRKIVDRYERARKRPQLRAGAKVRKIARRSMRRRKKASRAGSPPSVHSGEPNLRTIFFAWDPAIDGVTVGPVRLSGEDPDPRAPEVNEFGGTAVRTLIVFAGQKPNRRPAGKKKIRARYPKRDFMMPATETMAEKYPEEWKDAIG